MDPFDDDIENLLALERARPDIDPEHARAIMESAAQQVALSPPHPEPADASAAADVIGASKAAAWSVLIFAAGLGTGVALTYWLMTTPGAVQVDVEDAGVPDQSVVSPSSDDHDPWARALAAGDEANEVNEVNEANADDEPATQGDGASANAPIVERRTPRLAADVPPGPNDGAPPAATRADDQLNAERLLVEAAQSALARGQAAAALQYATDHAQRFPGGRLAAEREALAIRALLRLGRVASAQQRAAAFDARWPGSLLRGSFAAALERAHAVPEAAPEAPAGDN